MKGFISFSRLYVNNPFSGHIFLTSKELNHGSTVY